MLISSFEVEVGQLGIGGVHHIAFRTPNGEEQTQWLERLHGFATDEAAEHLGERLAIPHFWSHVEPKSRLASSQFR